MVLVEAGPVEIHASSMAVASWLLAVLPNEAVAEWPLSFRVFLTLGGMA